MVSSDERKKENLPENTLDKTLRLICVPRPGVEYNDFKIEPGQRKRGSVIAKKVEIIAYELAEVNEIDNINVSHGP
jgi:hypothetical protein